METTNAHHTPQLSADEIARLNALAVEVEISSITIGDRVRRDFSHVPALAESIKSEGLIQPIVLSYDRRLIAGESRIRAVKSLGLTTIRAVFRGVLDEAQLVVLEASENNARQDLTWQERCLSVDKVHRLRTLNAIQSGEAWGVRETGALLKQGKSSVQYCVAVAAYLHKNDQDIWKAESLSDAFRILALRKAKELEKAIVAQTIPKTDVKYTGTAPKPLQVPVMGDADIFGEETGAGFEVAVTGPKDTGESPGGVPASAPKKDKVIVPLSQMLFRGNAVDTLFSFAPDTFNHIITDWPYAEDMDNLIQNVEETKKEHDVEENRALQLAVLPGIEKVLKPGGFFITFCDISLESEALAHLLKVVTLMEKLGFGIQRWPLVWHKTSACANQAANTNFTKNYEYVLVARKGVATLTKPQPSSIWTGGNDTETKLLGHPFAKPFGLWQWVYDAVCRRGDSVLDPFAGCGSSTIAAIKSGLRPTAIELTEHHYNRMVVNVSNVYKSMDPNVEFV